MRLFLSFFIVLVCSISFSQDDVNESGTKKTNMFRHHQLEISPASIWFNKWLSYGHRLKYSLHLKGRMQISLESNGTLFRVLDDRASELPSEKVIPLLNQSAAIFTKNIYGVGKTINRKKQKRFVSSIRLGYHFFQHATGYYNYDYWAYDSTELHGYQSVRSFQSHSLSVGYGLEVQKYLRKDGAMKQVASHALSVDYLGAVHYQLTGYSVNDEKQYNPQQIKNPFAVRKSGARFTYKYTRFLNNYFGIHLGVEALYVPFLKDYSANKQYFVPRGGELVFPLFTNLHLGVSFVF